MSGTKPSAKASAMVTTGFVPAGFADPVFDSQAVFRAVLDAMAHPGRVVPLNVATAALPPLGPGMMSIVLCLTDRDTPVWCDAPDSGQALGRALTFLTGCPLTDDPGAASFALITDLHHLPPLDMFDRGTDERPDQSATLLIEVAALHAGAGVRLSGPGIDGACLLDVGGLAAPFWQARRAMQSLFPRGIDIIFVAGTQIAALPRSTRIGG